MKLLKRDKKLKTSTDASEGSVDIDPLVQHLSEKTLSNLETFIQYYYLLGIVYITCEGRGGIIELEPVFHFEVLRFRPQFPR